MKLIAQVNLARLLPTVEVDMDLADLALFIGKSSVFDDDLMTESSLHSFIIFCFQQHSQYLEGNLSSFRCNKAE